VVIAAPVEVRLMGRAAKRCWLPGMEFVRVWGCAGRTNRSAIDDGGDLRDVREGRHAGRPGKDSRWWFLARVGVNSGPSSKERKREESRDSSSSSWKFGEER
jgi:hypothetical protein